MLDIYLLVVEDTLVAVAVQIHQKRWEEVLVVAVEQSLDVVVAPPKERMLAAFFVASMLHQTLVLEDLLLLP